MAATPSATLPSTFLPCPGFRESCRILNWRTHKKQLVRKAGAVKVRATFELEPPPYPMNALEPHMSRTTFEYHWGKHHRAYVDNLNKQIVGTELDDLTLEDIILVTYNRGDLLPPFNNAAQAWNHQFFWESMKPGGGGKPSGELLELINRDFGSFEAFVKEFKTAAATQFGSGWAWLAYKANRLDVGNASNPHPSDEDKKLVIVKTPNAVNPLVWDYSPLLTIDVWEHAYHLDFRSRRAEYISIFMEKLVSWEAVSSRLEAAKAQAAEREKEEERKRREEEEEYQAGDEVREMYVESTDSEAE
ncbi:superoxide dismutase [Fe], chloroplastic [Lycium ferocissimum]|uniref:superoxide dismutase [Fe], chloroplastic n=1 Tax=Lycium ferocissimum TaxID=112874 RepID=UPI002814E490|nr:superoxide dismutase [Fe], chloroplastic [Lycium ferocissimum]